MKIVLEIPPHIAVALSTIAANQAEGDSKFSRKFTREKCAEEMLEVKVIETFKAIYGAGPGEYFACPARRARRPGGKSEETEAEFNYRVYAEGNR